MAAEIDTETKKRKLVDNFDYESARKKYQENIEHYICSNRGSDVYNKKINDYNIEMLLDNERRILQKRPRTGVHIRLSCKYELLKENNKIYVIKKREKSDQPVIKYIPYEESFDILLKIHLETSHGDSKQMHKAVQQHYVLYDSLIDLFLLCCDVCRQRQGEKFIRSDEIYNEVVQVDIINMEKVPDGLFSYILVYVNKKTSFTLLRPMMKKCPQELSMEFMKIYLDFGPPLQLEVVSSEYPLFEKVRKRIVDTFSHCNFTIESINKSNNSVLSLQIVKEIQDWMAETGSKNWALGCHILQWKLNNLPVTEEEPSSENRHSRSPYCSLFGTDPLILKKTCATDDYEMSDVSDDSSILCMSDDDETDIDYFEKGVILGNLGPQDSTPV